MSQLHTSSSSGGNEEESAECLAKSASVNTSATDSLLDEIDDILEVNAEEFVKSYVQKGGQ